MRVIKFSLIILLLITLVLLPVFYVGAQDELKIMIINVDVQSAYPEMSATVFALNAYGVPIKGLNKDNFAIFEDGTPLTVTSVMPDKSDDPSHPIAVVLVLDLSGSAPLDDVKEAAHQFLNYLGPSDRVALIGFNEPLKFDEFDPLKEVGFTNDKDLVHNVIDGLTIIGKSAVYEAIYKGIRITAEEKAERRAVIVMTDGYDTASRPQIATADTPKRAAKEAHIPVFTIGVYNPDPSFGRDPDYLKVLAAETGGDYQEAIDSTKLGELFQNVVNLLRLRYHVSFSTVTKPDGKEHLLTFRVNVEGNQAEGEYKVTYPSAPPIPRIWQLNYEKKGEIEPLPSKVDGIVKVIPDISAPRPLDRVEYYVDGNLMYTAKEEPWEWIWNTTQLENGAHTLKVVVYDNSGYVSPEYSVNVEVRNTNWILIIILASLVLLAALLVTLWLFSRQRKPVEVVMVEPTVPSTPPPSAPSEPVTPGPTVEYAPPSPAVSGAPAPSAPPVQTPTQPTEVLSKEPQAMAWLVVQEGPMAGREFRLSERTRIGRSEDNDIVLDDPTVSREHAVVKLEGDSFIIQDLGATNPTKVNGQEIGRHRLVDGDRVEIGRVVMVFKQV